jgi:ribonucleoside-diphosphate reductase alpha chain
VDAIKFTLDNSKKKEEPVTVSVESESTAATAEGIQVTATSVGPQEIDIQPMSPEEMKEMIARAKEGQADDDCLMCGS